MRPVYTPPSGETLLPAAALAAARLAHNRSAEELAVLSAFFCTRGTAWLWWQPAEPWTTLVNLL